MKAAARRKQSPQNFQESQQLKITLQDVKLMDVFEKCINVGTVEEKNPNQSEMKDNTMKKTENVTSSGRRKKRNSPGTKKTDAQSVIKCIYGEVSVIVADPYEVKYDKKCLNALNKFGKDREIKLSEFAPEALKCFKDN